MTGNDFGPPVVVILGPTAVGKTRLALDLAQALNGEIIGADSRQIYRHMDIGTAKPTQAERAQVVHHLIDLISPDDHLTLERYQKLAYSTIDGLHAAGKLPLLVGGTGQYITAVTEGWAIPEVAPNDALRSALTAFAEQHGPDALHARLAAVDPETAARIHPNNVRRVIRSLEVFEATGRTFSSLQQKYKPPYTILEVGLMMNRDALRQRADLRVDTMLAEGFVEEVERLLSMGFSPALPSMSGLGYAQLAAHLLGHTTLHEAIAATKRATHDFIRRQLTWFRGHDNGIVWHDVQCIEPVSIIALCDQWLKERC